MSILTHPYRRSGSLFSILAFTVLAIVWSELRCAAQSPRSELMGIDVPGAIVSSIKGPASEAARSQLTAYAAMINGFASPLPEISRAEVFIWTGDGYNPAVSDSVTQSVTQSLRQSGWNYSVKKILPAGATSVIIFLAARQTPQITVIGAWSKGPKGMSLVWGQMGASGSQAGANAAQASAFAPKPTAALLRAKGAKMVDDANIPASLRAQVRAMAGGMSLPVRRIQMMMWQPDDYKRAGALGHIARIVKSLESAGYACSGQRTQKTQARDVTNFMTLNASKTQGATGLWLATDKSLTLCWAEVGGATASGGLPDKTAPSNTGAKSVRVPEEKGSGEHP